MKYVLRPQFYPKGSYFARIKGYQSLFTTADFGAKDADVVTFDNREDAVSFAKSWAKSNINLVVDEVA